MKTKQITLLALSLTLGVMVTPSFALKNGETRTESSQTVTRGTSNGVTGYWVEKSTKTFRFTEDAATTAALSAAGIDKLDAATAASIHDKIYSGEMTVDAACQYIRDLLALNNQIAGLDPAIAAAIRDKLAAGQLNLASAAPYIKQLTALEQQNKNSNYPENLPAAFLTSTGAISNQTATQVGAFGGGIGVDTKIRNAYLAAGIDPVTKRMPNGQILSGNFNTMISQLQTAGIATFDWDFNTLMNDLNRNEIVRMANTRNGVNVAGSWNGNQQNLFSKNNLTDPTLQHDYSAGLGGVTADDATVRGWISTYDGIGAFNNRGDVDLYMAVTYSSAAKLVAESKALRALGLSAQADAKVVAARNIVLLTGNNHDPLVLDLNHNGKIDVTGLSSAKTRIDANKQFVKEGSVKFDLLANGQGVQTEWIKGGDGFLVDNRKNQAIAAIAAGKNLTGANLFGDVEGFPGGFLKLGVNFDNEAKFASNEKIRLSADFGTLKGEELNNLMVWVDNGDGIASRNELKSLKDLGITEISVRPTFNKEKGEMLEQAYFIQNGEKRLIQEVWFNAETK